MSGAVSFVLGLLGLGAATGVSAVQDAGINKKKDQVAGFHCWEGDPETLKMRRRVRDEWMSKAHLDAKGIPYDDEILDEVSHVNGDRNNIALMYSAGKKRRGWF